MSSPTQINSTIVANEEDIQTIIDPTTYRDLQNQWDNTLDQIRGKTYKIRGRIKIKDNIQIGVSGSLHRLGDREVAQDYNKDKGHWVRYSFNVDAGFPFSKRISKIDDPLFVEVGAAPYTGLHWNCEIKTSENQHKNLKDGLKDDIEYISQCIKHGVIYPASPEKVALALKPGELFQMEEEVGSTVHLAANLGDELKNVLRFASKIDGTVNFTPFAYALIRSHVINTVKRHREGQLFSLRSEKSNLRVTHGGGAYGVGVGVKLIQKKLIGANLDFTVFTNSRDLILDHPFVQEFLYDTSNTKAAIAFSDALKGHWVKTELLVEASKNDGVSRGITENERSEKTIHQSVNTYATGLSAHAHAKILGIDFSTSNSIPNGFVIQKMRGHTTTYSERYDQMYKTDLFTAGKTKTKTFWFLGLPKHTEIEVSVYDQDAFKVMSSADDEKVPHVELQIEQHEKMHFHHHQDGGTVDSFVRWAHLVSGKNDVDTLSAIDNAITSHKLRHLRKADIDATFFESALNYILSTNNEKVWVALAHAIGIPDADDFGDPEKREAITSEWKSLCSRPGVCAGTKNGADIQNYLGEIARGETLIRGLNAIRLIPTDDHLDRAEAFRNLISTYEQNPIATVAFAMIANKSQAGYAHGMGISFSFESRLSKKEKFYISLNHVGDDLETQSGPVNPAQ